jgi:hypothetical protein
VAKHVGWTAGLLRDCIFDVETTALNPIVRLALDQPYPSGFRPLPSLGETEGDAFTFIEGREPGWCESRNMDEYVLATAIPSDKAEAFVDVEPFHGAGLFERGTGRWPARCRLTEARSYLGHGSSSARIDGQHLGDVRPFVAGADTNFERFSWPDGGDPAMSQYASVKEGVTGTIREFDPKPLSALNHFTTARTGGPEGASNRGSLKRGLVPEARDCGKYISASKSRRRE